MQDLLQDCMEDFRRKAKLTTSIPPSDFRDLFCSKCNNNSCVNSRSGDPLAARVATQFERLTQPLQANPEDPKYAQIVGFDWEDMAQQAKRLVVSATRNDWTVPDDPYEIPITDGISRLTSTENTQQLRDSVRHLAQAQGRGAPGFLEPELEGGELDATPDPEPKPVDPAPQHPKANPKFRPDGRGNAPSQDGMIGSTPPVVPKSTDPWAPPPTGNPKVQAGAVITFDSEGKIRND